MSHIVYGLYFQEAHSIGEETAIEIISMSIIAIINIYCRYTGAQRNYSQPWLDIVRVESRLSLEG